MKIKRILPALLLILLLVIISLVGLYRQSLEHAPPPSDSSPQSSLLEESPAGGSSESSSSESSSSESTEPSSEASESSEASAHSSQASASSSAASSSASQSSSVSSSSQPASESSSSASEEDEVVSPPVSLPNGPAAGRHVVGYYASYARSSGFTPLNVDAGKLTHLSYAFATIDGNGEIALPSPSMDRQNFADLRTLKQQYPQLVTLISVGGWDYSGNFSVAAATSASRKAFAESCVNFILTHGFDGVDLDWEFPSATEAKNYTLLLQAVRNALDRQSAKDGKRYYLTMAWSASPGMLGNLQPAKVASIVDYIFLMGYDLHGPWDSYADLNAPLYQTDDSPNYQLSLDGSIRAYRNAGIPARKIVLGMPFYGYRYEVDDDSNDGLYSTFSSGSSISFNKISSLLSEGSFFELFHDSARVPYLFDGSTFITYDDEDSIAEKVQLARSYGLRGIGAWELSQDRSASLLTSAYYALNG